MPESYKDADTLRELYWGEGLSLRKTADRLGVGASTVKRWMKKHNIPRRGRLEASLDRFSGKDRATLSFYRGYHHWRCRDVDCMRSVAVHRLLAVAEYGMDEIDGKHIHHKNGIPWDNRPENIEPLSPSDHMSLHHGSD